jgi:transposase
VIAPAGAVLPKKYFRDLIKERRENIKMLMGKGILSVMKISKALQVCEETVRRDIKAIHEDDKDRLTRKAGPGHVTDLLTQIEQVIVNASGDYISMKEQSPRANSVKSQLHQTMLRALALKATLLQQTGVIAGDITGLDKILDAELSESRVKGEFDPRLAAVVTEADSRRKVLSVAEHLRNAAPDVITAVLAELSKDPVDTEMLQEEVPSKAGGERGERID